MIEEKKNQCYLIHPPIIRKMKEIMEWNLSVVYSETWNVPVLYFRVQYLDGRVCSRDTILLLIQLKDDFVSEEEHPIHGVPCFFLHPCQTHDCLQLLDNDCNIVLRWMMMVLPAVKCKIPLFQFFRECQ